MGESSAPEMKNKISKQLALFSTELHKSFTFISKSLPTNKPEIVICDNQLENLTAKLQVFKTWGFFSVQLLSISSCYDFITTKKLKLQASPPYDNRSELLSLNLNDAAFFTVHCCGTLRMWHISNLLQLFSLRHSYPNTYNRSGQAVQASFQLYM